MTTPFELVLSKFPRAKLNKDGRSFQARCPCHNDQRPSLSVSEGKDGRVLLKCHAGCQTERIVAALGLKMSDLFPPRRAHQGQREEIVASYDYRDERGRLLYQSVRLSPKGFFQRRPDGRGGWIHNMQNVTYVPYRLPELLAAPATETVFIVEGEQDADRLAELGLLATTNAAGAGKWRPEYGRYFIGRQVCLIPDNDEPGQRHAQTVAQHLHPLARSVKILTLPGLPAKGDVSDWLDAGGDVATLRTMAERAPAWTPADIGAPARRAGSGKPTHDELADRWLAMMPQTTFGLGDWRRYQNGIWPVLSELTVKREIKDILIAAKEEGIKPSKSIVCSVADLAKYEVAVDNEQFDADPDYLVCTNGTLHIPTRTLGPHEPNLYTTSGVAYNYDPKAAAPHWTYFLTSILADDVAGFLQEFAGYALTTDTHYEIAVWLYGPPGGGKSTFQIGLQTMLGDRAGLVGLADLERNRFALANLPGKTLVVATEQPAMFLASTHTLNTIISGESITIDRKFKDAYDIVPRAKILWSMNELPRVNGPNNGLFRRVKVVEFPAIPAADQMPGLKEEIKKEGAGILNWALDGLVRLRRRGYFDIPTAVNAATENFKQASDIPAAFVADCCLVGCDAAGTPYKVSSKDLYAAYMKWCLETNHKPQSSTSIAEDWKRLGFEQYRRGGYAWWRFVGLQT